VIVEMYEWEFVMSTRNRKFWLETISSASDKVEPLRFIIRFLGSIETRSIGVESLTNIKESSRLNAQILSKKNKKQILFIFKCIPLLLDYSSEINPENNI
jgi:hypothetical protein